MEKIISIDKLKKKGLRKKNIIYIIFIIILIYIFYSIYLLIKTPNQTIAVEKGVLTQEEATVRVYSKR